MDGGLLHCAAALNLQDKVQEARAQNLANANTDGYRRRIAVADAFSTALRMAMGTKLPGAKESIDFTSGPLRETGNDLDLAIDGKAFFALDTARGTRFTKNGNFTLNADGEIVASDGARLQGTSGPIRVRGNGGPITIDGSGKVSQDGAALGQVRLVDFANDKRLVAEDKGRFRDLPGANPTDSLDSRIQQGALEGSNVNEIDELVQMISGLRAFEAAQKSLVGLDRLRGEALNNR